MKAKIHSKLYHNGGFLTFYPLHQSQCRYQQHHHHGHQLITTTHAHKHYHDYSLHYSHCWLYSSFNVHIYSQWGLMNNDSLSDHSAKEIEDTSLHVIYSWQWRAHFCHIQLIVWWLHTCIPHINEVIYRTYLSGNVCLKLLSIGKIRCMLKVNPNSYSIICSSIVIGFSVIFLHPLYQCITIKC